MCVCVCVVASAITECTREWEANLDLPSSLLGTVLRIAAGRCSHHLSADEERKAQ